MEFIDQVFIFPVYVFHASADVPCFLPRPSDLARVEFSEENESIVSWKSHIIWNFSHFPFDHDNNILTSSTIDYNTSFTFTDAEDSSSYGAPLVNSWFYNCVLCGRPSTRYYYLQSKTYSFEELPRVGTINPINITIIGDLGNDEEINHNDNCDSCQKAFAEVFYNFNVDFYFCGHVYWSECRHLFNGEGANTLNATRKTTTSANIIPDTYDYTR
ncbi:unnamed protein product [Adineta ricciae]|uniref:Uncharacterized protein n=1 Tax=Adineta ricciae TaxID=249248 RepID=A0A815UAV2_ADIRI|nr:unnamed protein product [Adineta ricciae]CAF1525498.1 unnamed protein product [Adineta ricciae]